MPLIRLSMVPLLAITAAFSRNVDLGTYAGCSANDSDFTATVLFQGPVPASNQDSYANAVLKLAFAGKADGAPDVFLIQKQGTVRRYNGRTGATDSLGVIPVDYSGSDFGLTGIGARRDFQDNPWLYFFYSYQEPDSAHTPTFRLTRIRLTPDLSRLDMGTEKVLIKIKAIPGWNTAGALQFDAYDDLWVAVGDDMVTDDGAGNTADLRGGILRIHPDESARGYSIPAGNFADHFHAYYAAKGMPDIAARYLDPAVVKPELYIKGADNPYTLTLDPVRRWVTWGDVGPDQGRVSEEYNLVKEPVFAGWPYYAGEEDMTGIAAYTNAGPIQAGSTRAAPVNGKSLGIGTLPPVAAPIFARTQSCAMTGPILRYDGSIGLTGQWPPQLDRKWLISGCDSYGWHLLTLDSAGDHVLNNVVIFDGLKPATLVDLQQGPDGQLYYIDWGKGTLNRIAYSGTCRDPGKRMEKTGCADSTASNFDPGLPKSFHDPRLCVTGTAVKSIARAPWVKFDGHTVSVSSSGPHRVLLLDLQGHVLASFSAIGPARHALPALPAAGIYRIRALSEAGVVDAPLPYLGR